MKRPTKPVLIKAENAKDYPPDPDTDYRVSDTTKHLKLRIYKSGNRVREYDYLYRGKRQKHKWAYESCTPTQARAKVAAWETNRKSGLDPFTKKAAGISLATFKDQYFEHKRIKPHTNTKGVKSGLSQKEYYERLRRFNKHFEGYAISQTPLLKLQLSEISDWFNKLSNETPSEAVACLFLGKHMTKKALESSDELRTAISNKFEAAINPDDLRDLKTTIDEGRDKRPLTEKEFKALDKTCKEYGDKLGGLMVRFIMATAVRGKHALDLAKADIVWDEDEEVYYFSAKFKRTWDTVVLGPTAKKIYEEILELHQEEGWITDYLFPSRDYTGGKYKGIRNRPMNSNDKQLIFTGRKRNSGIRAEAAKLAPSLLGVKAKTTADKDRYGEWKIKPVGLHDCRDTMASGASDLSTATAMIQNTSEQVTKKSYRDVPLSDKVKLAKDKDKIVKGLLKVV